MINWATDETGGTLVGALNGHNRVFRTLQVMRLDRIVDVYVNGQLRVAAYDNGYELTDAQTVTLKQAPVPEDTVAVSYCTMQAFPAAPAATPYNLRTEVVRPQPLTIVEGGGDTSVATTSPRPGPLRAHIQAAP